MKKIGRSGYPPSGSPAWLKTPKGGEGGGLV